MSAVDDIIAQLPMAQLAQQVGADQSQVEAATRAALPALLGGLDANAQHPSGAASIQEALGQHDSGLLDGGVDLNAINTTDGQRITSHIFGANEDQVISRLGTVSGTGDSSLISKLLPLLAPLVLAYLAKRMSGSTSGSASTGSGTSTSGGGGITDILGSILGGVTGGTSSSAGTTAAPSGGDILKDVLGGILGAGRR